MQMERDVTRRFLLTVCVACTIIVCTSGYAAWRVTWISQANTLSTLEFNAYKSWVEKEFAEIRVELQKAAAARIEAMVNIKKRLEGK